ncbi:MAG: hypothetical protein M3N53_05940 [Actinomycetota bacterium]|nr:hypothetical protein [Actinomycetota bacterium]
MVAVVAIGCGGDAAKPDAYSTTAEDAPADTDTSTPTADDAPADTDTSTPTADDIEIFDAVVSSSAVVQRAMQPLYVCLPGEVSCLKKAAPGVAEVIAQERSAVESMIEDADDPCIERYVALYEESLEAYEASARAAEEGNGPAFERELARSTRVEKAYVREWSRCGFFDRQQSRFITALGDALFDVLDAGEELVECATVRCINRGARKIEAAARSGVELVDDASTEAGESPECVQDALENARLTFSAMGKAARSIQEGRFRRAEQQAERGARFGIATQDLFASCTQQLFQQ